MVKVGKIVMWLVLRLGHHLGQRRLGHSKKAGDPRAQLENRRRDDGDRGAPKFAPHFFQ